MSERAALVTGGSAGIGLAIARLLAEEKHAVTIAARGEERLTAAVAELRTSGASVEGVRANLADDEDLANLVAVHRERWGRLDVLVNNAGVGLRAPIEELETKRLDLQLNLNLRSAFLLMRDCTPMLREAGGEHGKALVVNVSSLFGKIPQAHVAAYSATKAGLIALSASAHGELSEAGVQVCALCPGWVETPGTEWVQGVPRSSMIRAEDVAEAVRFLLRISPSCMIPELTMVAPGADLFAIGGSP